MGYVKALVGFARPHTVIATTLQVLTMWLIVAAPQRPFPSPAPLAPALIACLALNLFVVGVNQVVDVEIDRINKPWLPIAAGLIGQRAGLWLSLAAGLLGLVVAAAAGPYLLATVAAIMLIGGAYSLPPLHTKRSPFAAAISIALARGLLANLGLALHFGQALGLAVPLTTVLVAGLFFFGFCLVIALYKDMPDARGDRAGRIETFTIRLGSARVLAIGRALLTLCYALPIGLALWRFPEASALYLLVSHGLLIGLFWLASARVNLASQHSIGRFYMVIWRLFYTEFFVLGIYAVSRGTV